MKKLIGLASLGFVFAVSTPAFAGAQQDKMKGCNAEAKGMKGDERKAFMSKCLKKDYVLKSAAPAAEKKEAAPAKAEAKPAASAAAPSAKATQQDKMKSCNADATAKTLKGDERKKFMSSCLKG
jgi:psiF repeat